MASDEELYDAETDADEDDVAMPDEALLPSDSPADCWAITKDSLVAAQQQDLSMVTNLLNIKQNNARSLLIHHQWNMDHICDHLDRKGRDRMLTEAGIFVLENNRMTSTGSRALSGKVACNVCFEDFPLLAVTTMDCGHCFCNDCWTEHFFSAIDSGKKQIQCMEVKCSAICDEITVQRLLGQKYPDAAERFNHFLLESYIEDNNSVRWCPSTPHCGRAIRVDNGDRYCEVECPCGVSFCFNCGGEEHSPCPCVIWEKWNVKTIGESANINWILKNTRSCPKCFKPIEKDGGCNLVMCKCGQCLCWLCGGATGFTHTTTSIKGHRCNRFKEEEDKADAGRRQLRRYNHYSERFRIHGDSHAVEQKQLGEAIEERARRLDSTQMKRPPMIRDSGWLRRAHRRLVWSRRALLRSYAFAYYMFGGELPVHGGEWEGIAVAQSLFEDQQEQLERNVERLSRELSADVPALPDEGILRAKQEAINLGKIVARLCGEMYTCIQDELLPRLREPMSIAAYRPDGPDKAKELPA